MESFAEELPRLPQIGPDRRSNPRVRKQMSGAAIRTFFNIAREWQLSVEEQRALLGWPADSTFYNYKSGQVGTLSFDMLIRISLVMGIYKDLQILYPEQGLADAWVKLPNNNPLFGGQPAIIFMTSGGMDALFHVRRLLDARRGAWS